MSEDLKTHGTPWTDEELRYLRTMRALGCSYASIAAELNRTEEAARKRMAMQTRRERPVPRDMGDHEVKAEDAIAKTEKQTRQQACQQHLIDLCLAYPERCKAYNVDIKSLGL